MTRSAAHEGPRRLLLSVLLLGAGLAAAPWPADAQAFGRGQFRARPAEGGEVGCIFASRAELGSVMDRSTFVVPQCYGFTFTVIAGESMSAAAIDSRVEDAAEILRVDDQPGDSACLVGMWRVGPVGSFAEPPSMSGGVIETETDMDAVVAIEADVKIVASIQWCGQAGSYSGCRWNGSIILTPGFRAKTLAHERGHASGLCHVGTDCVPDCGQAGACSGCGDPSSTNVMWYRTCSDLDQNVLTAAQCTNFLP